MLKNTPHVNFGPFFGAKRWITLERKKISKIANKELEKRQLIESVANFKTKALAVRKLKRKRKLWRWTQKNGPFMYNFVQKTNATKQLWWHYTNFATKCFHTVFTRRSVWKGTLRRDQKAIFVKSPISSPIDALRGTTPSSWLDCWEMHISTIWGDF